MTTSDHRVDIRAPVEGRHGEVLTDDAIAFLAGLHRAFDARRRDLLARRAERQARLNMGGTLDFLSDTREIREGDWKVATAPDEMQRRRVEITGPTSAKMVINALNSGADGFMADFGRGWHLDEKHLSMDGRSMSGSLVDAGLYLFHNARRLLDHGSGPYFYVPKLEGHLEARLWNDVFRHAEDELGLDRGTVNVTVLVETIPAVFEMHEILYELRERPAALNAGRWDYIFSMIKSFRERPEFVLPDRGKVTMTVPFMRAYTELLVATSHRRGAHAIGGMAAFLPSRTDEEANRRADEKLREDKSREAGDGFDGTWVAHPDFVAPAIEEFDSVLDGRPNQVDRQRDDIEVTAAELLDAASAGGPEEITEAGLRSNVNVGIQYISSWLRGNGAAGIYGLMEDAATAEIARAQVWQWVRHQCTLEDGREITRDLVRELETEEVERIREEIGDDEWFKREGRPELSREIFEEVALAEEFVDFLTLPAYGRLP